MADGKKRAGVGVDSPEAYINRELSWLGFARRVLAMATHPEVPLLERIRFVGIVGMLHDEFFMKRMGGLKRQIAKGSTSASIDGLKPADAFAACQAELREQEALLAELIADLLPRLAEVGHPVRDYAGLSGSEKKHLRRFFEKSILPILTPLTVDRTHRFPFISNLGLNLAVELPTKKGVERFVRIKVPGNRSRWVELPGDAGRVRLEQVIAANLGCLFPDSPPKRVHVFRVTRAAEGDAAKAERDIPSGPGSIVDQVTSELKSRRFAGVVRLQVDAGAPKKLVRWLQQQLEVSKDDTFPTPHFLATRHLVDLEVPNGAKLRFPPHVPVPPPRLRAINGSDPSAIFREISRGDILLHHPYESFDWSVLRFLESAAEDPDVLAIKLTIYRTSRDSPIVRALTEAVRRGKQVAVVVEITARFDEEPNIAWGKALEREGVHVSYGVERLKTHVKLALVIREEQGELRRYLHAGTGNYHTGTARLYEDLGVLTANQELCEEAAAVFNSLTGGAPHGDFSSMIVAPENMRTRFVELIRREAEHAAAGRPSGIQAKMNQLQDPEIIRELYGASRAGVPISLIVRGLCCLRPGVKGLSESIRASSVVGRFLEHSRVYRFENGGAPQVWIGSADWMKRNLNRRVETLIPILDADCRARLDRILDVYGLDNASAWDCGADGLYVRREPAAGEPRIEAQTTLLRLASGEDEGPRTSLVSAS